MRLFFFVPFFFGLLGLQAQVHEGLPYQLLRLGPEAEAGRALPLVVFLHGAGERGNENERQAIHLRHWRERVPEACWVLAPQCPEGRRWAETSWSAAAHRHDTLAPSQPMLALLSLLDSLRALPEVDTQRIYLMGLSMGGYGSWDLALRQPKWFAGLVPVCGGSDPKEACQLKGMGIWVFHGRQDRLVPVHRSRQMVAALRACGFKVRYEEYPKVGHGAWEPAFKDPRLLPWLFAQKRSF